jgi:hypothetical protein
MKYREMEFSYRELQKCAEREAAMRTNVYRRHGKGRPSDMREIEMMRVIASLMKDMADGQDLTELVKKS